MWRRNQLTCNFRIALGDSKDEIEGGGGRAERWVHRLEGTERHGGIQLRALVTIGPAFPVPGL